jgi:hypothetical protein
MVSVGGGRACAELALGLGPGPGDVILSRYPDASWSYTTAFLHKTTYYTSSSPTS